MPRRGLPRSTIRGVHGPGHAHCFKKTQVEQAALLVPRTPVCAAITPAPNYVTAEVPYVLDHSSDTGMVVSHLW